MSKIFTKVVLLVSVSIFLLMQDAVLAMEPVAIPDTSSKTNSATGNTIFMGQNHKYYVIFRGTGEAIVYAGIEFTNTSDNVMSEFNFEASTDLKDMTIFQYDPNQIIYQPEMQMYKPSDGVIDSIKPTDSMYPYYGSNIYNKLKFNLQDLKYTIELANPIKPNQHSNLLLGYTTRNFTSEFLGGFNYTFKSLKVDSRIEDLTLSITTDSGLFLKNTDAVINYAAGKAAVMDSASVADKSISNTDLDNIVNSLNGGGEIYKTYKQLAAGETVNLDGQYSATWIRLYANEIFTILLVIVALVVALIVLKKYLTRRKPAEKSNKPLNWIVTDISLGFISAILVTILSIGVIYSSYFYGGIYNGYIPTRYSPVISLIFALILFLLYVLLTLTAPIHRAIKNGWSSFALTLFSEILFLIFFSILISLLFSISSMGESSYLGIY